MDLFAIDLDSLELPVPMSFDEKVPLKKNESLKKNPLKEKGFHDEMSFDDETSDVEDDPVVSNDDFDDDFDFDDSDDEDGDEEKGDGYTAPKDFFTDKRRKKVLKKFLDVTVAPEFLE